MDADTQVGTSLHTLELNRAESCPLDKSTGLYFDPRYASHDATTGGDITEFNLFEQEVLVDNGVDEIIKSLPSTFQLVDTASKSRRRLQFNTRNTIPWKLECERKGLDREYGIQSFSISVEQDGDLIEPIENYVTAALALLGIFTCCSCCCGTFSISSATTFFGAMSPLVSTCCLKFCAIIMASVVMSYLTTISDTTDNNLKVLNEA